MNLKLPEGDFCAYLFDCDGTIADSMPLHHKAWKKALAEYGATYEEDLFYAWGGKPVRKIIADLNEMQGLDSQGNAGLRDKVDHHYRQLLGFAVLTTMFDAALAVKAGVDARLFIETVNASTGRNTATTDKFPASILTRSFDYGGKLATMYKDVTLCLDEAKQRDVPMWVGANVVQLWFHAMSEGRGNDDYTTIMKMIEQWAGVTVGGNEE